MVRIFDRHGNRKDKARARIKFVLKDWGHRKDAGNDSAGEERKIALLTRSGRHPDFKINPHAFDEEAPKVDLPGVIPESKDPGYQRWRLTNVKKEQKQAGYNSVLVRCLLGDIYVPQMHALAALSRRYSGGRLRTAITQNLVLQWVPEKGTSPGLRGVAESRTGGGGCRTGGGYHAAAPEPIPARSPSLTPRAWPRL